MEALAKIAIWLLGMFLALLAACLISISYQGAGDHAGIAWRILGWWALFAVPVCILGFGMLRHRDLEHDTDVDNVFR